MAALKRFFRILFDRAEAVFDFAFGQLCNALDAMKNKGLLKVTIGHLNEIPEGLKIFHRGGPSFFSIYNSFKMFVEYIIGVIFKKTSNPVRRTILR